MKRTFFLIILCMTVCRTTIAQINDVVTFSFDNITFDTIGEHIRVGMLDCNTTDSIGHPELPRFEVKYIIPLDKHVAEVNVTDSTVQILQGIYNIYPNQYDTPIGDAVSNPFFLDSIVYRSSDPYFKKTIEFAGETIEFGYHVAIFHIYPLNYIPSLRLLQFCSSLSFTIQLANYNSDFHRPKMESRQMFEMTKKLITSQIRNVSDFNSTCGGPEKIIEINEKNITTNSIIHNNLGVIPQYIIITNNRDIYGNEIEPFNGQTMTDIFQTFADWKTQKGVPTSVVTIDDICDNYPGNDIQSKIHNFLTDIYQEIGSTYILFGGDVNIVPERIVDTMKIQNSTERIAFPTDLYYTAIETSWDSNHNGIYGEFSRNDNDITDKTSEFIYGRIPSENANEALTFSLKVLTYEKLNNIDNINYVNNVLMMVGMLDDSIQKYQNYTTENLDSALGLWVKRKKTDVIWIDGICHDNIVRWRLFEDFYLFDSVSNTHIFHSIGHENHSFDLCRGNVVNALGLGFNNTPYNEFPHLIFHTDHSSYSTIGTSVIHRNEKINRDDVDNLSNAPYFHILMTQGCSPGEFQKDCIVERLLNNPNGGAVAVLASTSLSFRENEKKFQYRFISSCFDSQKNGVLSHALMYNLGSVFLRVHNQYNIQNEVYIKRKNHLFGDPELPIWTREPVNLTVSTTPSVITNIDNELTVSVRGMAYSEYATNDVMVCVMKDNDVYLREHYNGTAHNHDFVFEIDPETAGTLKVTVTGHNYIPYETTVPVTITGKHFYIADKSVMDASGNNNGQLDAGETDHLSIALTNNGNVNLTDVTATLSCEFSIDSLNQNINNYLTLVTPTANYGTIAPNDTVVRSSFQLALSNAIPDRTALHCTLTLGNNTGTIGTRSFSLPIGAPEIEHVSMRHETKPNGRIGVDIDLTNVGFGTAKNITSTLSSPYDIQITQSTASYGAMTHLEAKTQSFEFVPTGNFVEWPFTLSVVDAYNKSWSFCFTLKNITDTVENLTFESAERSIKLKWDPVANSKGYYVYRSLTAGGNYERLNNYPIPSSAYPDLGLEAKQVYYYGVSYVDEDGNESEKARITAWTSLPVAEGWPVAIPDGLGRVWNTAPNVADVDGDGKKEIFLTTGDAENPTDIGAVLGFNCLGEELYDIDHDTATVSGFADIGINMACTPAIGDIDNDGIMEIVVATRGITENKTEKKHILYVYKNEDSDGDGMPDLFWRDTLVFQNFNGVVLADLDDNGTLEIIAPNQRKKNDQVVVEIFSCFGDTTRIRIPPTYNVDEKAVTMPVVADFDNDGDKEIVFGLEGGVYSWNDRTTNPIDTIVSFFTNNERTDCPVIAADMDGDGDLELLYMAIKNNGKKGCIRAINPEDKSFVSGWDGDAHYVSVPDTNMKWVWPPYFSVADIDNDGGVEVFVANEDTLKMWSSDGTAFGIGEIRIPNLDCRYFQPVIADVDGHGDCEIIVPSQNGYIHAYKPDGNTVPGWPLNVVDLATIPVVADIDGDGYNEVVAASQTELYVWQTEGESRYNHCDRFRYNSYNNAVYEMPCSQNGVLEITGSQTWIDDRQLGKDVVVDNGADLTVKAELRLSGGSRIIVKPGGILTLDGGVLTNACPDEMWQGVEVWGNSAQNQYPSNGSYAQGRLELRNGAVIENAVCAVELWRPGHYSTTGGIVHADSATFRNNAKAVHALHYTNSHPESESAAPYAAFFQNCSFVVDSAYLGTEIFYKHVDLDHVDGVTFNGCRFSVDPEASNVSSTSHGIAAYEAGFLVSGYCSHSGTGHNICPDEYLVRSSFTGFNSAVHAVNYGSDAYSFRVTNSLFYGNDRGVFAQNTGYATILHNEFRVGSDAECAYGIQVKDVTGFCIEENTLSSLETRSVNFGIGVFDCSANNDIYRNSFNGLDCGNVAVGINSAVTPGPPIDLITSGLTYTCNQNTLNTIDFCVLKDGNIGGIKTSQGSSSSPAGNTFSGSDYHFYNDGDLYLNYYYDANGTGQTPDPSKLYRVSRVSTNNSNGCPEHYGSVIKSPQEKSELESDFLAAREAYSSLLRIYTDRLDGGNTPAEVAGLASATPSDAQRLRARLLGLSPYLSQQVLTAVADRDDVFSDPVLFEILASNPDELKKDTLISYLEQRNPPLPAYMIGLLRQIAAGATPRTILTAQLAQYGHDGRLAAGDIVRSVLNDTVADTQELRSWLGNVGEIASDRLAIASYVQEGDFESAFGLAALLPDLYGLDGDGLRDHSDYMRLLGLFRTLHVSGRTTAQMTENELGMVDSIANGGTGFSKSMAEAIRESVIEEPRANYTCPDLPVAGRSVGNTGVGEVVDKTGFSVSVTPNPAGSRVNVNYVLPEGESEAVLEMASVLGVKVVAVALEGRRGSKEIDLGSLPSGIYNYTVRCGDSVLSGKLIVVN